MLIGAFAGAPVLARELETGTFRYAWTQGFGRWRWALAKLVLLAVAVTAAAGVFSLLLSWYYQPYFAAGNQTVALTEMTPFFPGLFDLRGIGFAAWTLAAFAIGALAGMLIRRVVPAIVATLAAYAGLAFATGGCLRRAYMTPVVTSNLNVPGSAWIISQWWTKGGRFAFAGSAPPTSSSSSASGPSGAVGPGGKPEGGRPRAVPHPARLHAVDQLPAGQPVLAIPVDRGRLAARAVSAAHRRDRLAGPPPRRLSRLATAAQPASSHSPDDRGNQGHHADETGSRRCSRARRCRFPLRWPACWPCSGRCSPPRRSVPSAAWPVGSCLRPGSGACAACWPGRRQPPRPPPPRSRGPGRAAGPEPSAGTPVGKPPAHGTWPPASCPGCPSACSAAVAARPSATSSCAPGLIRPARTATPPGAGTRLCCAVRSTGTGPCRSAYASRRADPGTDNVRLG